MKNKLLNSLGVAGIIMWYVVSAVVYVMPFVMIGASFWVNLLLFGIVYFFPPSSIVFWIWGLVCAIQGPQDVWAIIYYVLFVIMFLPFFVSTICDIFNTLHSNKTRKQQPTQSKIDSNNEPPNRPDVYISWRD